MSELRDDLPIGQVDARAVQAAHDYEPCPTAEATCEVVLLERSSTLNTGNVENERAVRDLSRL